MEDAMFGLVGGGGISAISILYTIWQTKKNSDDIEEMEKTIGATDKALSDYKVHVAETYVPIGRFLDLEKKIEKIYDHVMKITP